MWLQPLRSPLELDTVAEDFGAVSEVESRSVSLLYPSFPKVGLWEDPETRVCKN